MSVYPARAALESIRRPSFGGYTFSSRESVHSSVRLVCCSVACRVLSLVDSCLPSRTIGRRAASSARAQGPRRRRDPPDVIMASFTPEEEVVIITDFMTKL